MTTNSFAAIAARDGLTEEQARVLVEMWAWPIGWAIRPAYKKAQDNHPDWQTWCAAQRDTAPPLAEWLLHVERSVSGRG